MARALLEQTLKEIKCVPLYDLEPIPTPLTGRILGAAGMTRRTKSLIDFTLHSVTPNDPRSTTGAYFCTCCLGV